MIRILVLAAAVVASVPAQAYERDAYQLASDWDRPWIIQIIQSALDSEHGWIIVVGLVAIISGIFQAFEGEPRDGPW